MTMRWRAAVASLVERYPALLQALPDRVMPVRQGAAVGLARAGVVVRLDWLATVDWPTLQSAVLHLSAHAALGHRPWRTLRPAVSAVLDDEVRQFLHDLGVPDALAQWQDDHHGGWLGLPEQAPDDAWMARPASALREAAAATDESVGEADACDVLTKPPATEQSAGDALGQPGSGRGAGRPVAWLEPPAHPLDWRALLTVWLTRRAYQRWQFDRPSRRHVPPVILPRLGGRRLTVALAVDVSGSIDPIWIAQFLTEAERLRAQLPMSMRLMTCDNRLHEDRLVASLARVDVSAGGGGTDFRPVFDKIAHDAAVDALIYCTDLSGTFPERAPAFPVFWLVPWQTAPGQRRAPAFGTVLWMKVA